MVGRLQKIRQPRFHLLVSYLQAMIQWPMISDDTLNSIQFHTTTSLTAELMYSSNNDQFSHSGEDLQ